MSIVGKLIVTWQGGFWYTFGMDGIETELDREELIALVVDLRKVNDKFREENVALRKRVEELEGKKPTKRLEESYSLRAEERRQELFHA